MKVASTYEARTGSGILVHTFDSMDLAKQWGRDNAERLPGLTIKEVTTTVVERTVWRQRAVLQVAREQRGHSSPRQVSRVFREAF
jgi:hypothetical protein